MHASTLFVKDFVEYLENHSANFVLSVDINSKVE